MRLVPLVLTILALAALAVPGRAEEISKKEAKARDKAAPVLAQWARACAEAGATDAGAAALAEARELGLDEESAVAVEEALDAAGGALDEDALEKARRSHARKVVKAYDALADATDADAREERWRLAALRWDPSKGRGRKLAGWAMGMDDEGRRARLLGAALAAAGDSDAVEPIRDAVADEAGDGLFLLGTAEHPLVAFLSLPKGWKPGGSYPVLIGVDGAGSNFAGYGRKSISSRGSRPVIGLYPMTLSNTNALNAAKYPHYAQETLDTEGASVLKRLAFDHAGVEAILALLRAHFGAEEKVFVTGFSGGGQYTYYRLLQDPEGIAGAVPCCANFGGGGAQGAPKVGDDGGPPVLILTGANDPHREFTHGNEDSPGIEPQTDAAMKTLGDLGYAHVERRMVEAGHSPLHRMAWEFVEGVLDAR